MPSTPLTPLLISASLFLGPLNTLQAENSVNSGRPEKPNILLLLTDDLGWQDVDCYDIDEKNSYVTPNIDALASKGVKFWRAYSPAPTCAPSRCAIISGVHPARAQKTHIKGGTPPRAYSNTSRMMSPWFSARTPVGDYTIASAMKDHGYTTGHKTTKPSLSSSTMPLGLFTPRSKQGRKDYSKNTPNRSALTPKTKKHFPETAQARSTPSTPPWSKRSTTMSAEFLTT